MLILRQDRSNLLWRGHDNDRNAKETVDVAYDMAFPFISHARTT